MSANKRSSTMLCLKADVSKSENRKRDEDDFFLAYFSNEIKDVVSALYQIIEKAENNSLMKIKEDTISSVAFEIKSMLDVLKSTIEKDRQTFVGAVSKKSIEIEIATFRGLNERFCNKKAAQLQTLEEMEKLVMRYEKLSERPDFIHYVLKLQRERSPSLALLAPRQTFRAPCVLQRQIEPFLLSHSPEQRFYMLHFRDSQRNMQVKFSEKIDISKWKIVSHNATSGWIMLVNEKTVAFYHIVQHRVFTVMEKTPYDFGSNCEDLDGCFSGDPDSDCYMIMLVLRLERKLGVFRYSAALASWIRPTGIALYRGHTPFGHIEAGGNFLWVDQSRNNVFIISNWEDLKVLNVTRTPLPDDYPRFPVTSVKIGDDIYFIAIRIGADPPQLDVLLANFNKDGRLLFDPVNGFKGFNLYAEFGGRGIGCLSTGVDDQYITNKNAVYLSGVGDSHCTRYVNFRLYEDQIKCPAPQVITVQEVARAAVEAGLRVGAWADDESESESDEEEDPGVCKCSLLWFHINA